MNDLNFPAADNFGGVDKFWFVETKNIVSIPEPVDEIIPDDVVLVSGAAWSKGWVTKGTISFNEREQNSSHGELYRPVLEGFASKITPELKKAIRNLVGRKLVIIYKDHNGYYNIVGNSENYLEASYSLNPGTKPGDRNGIALRFEGEGARSFFIYTGQIVQAGGVVIPGEIGGIVIDLSQVRLVTANSGPITV